MVDDVVCLSCGASQSVSPVCAACGDIVPLPADADHYDALGIAPALELNADALQSRYYELSRRLHPDRSTDAAATRRDAGVRNMAAVNLAYRTLRDPILRARYWLSRSSDRVAKRDSRLPRGIAERAAAVHDLIGELRQRSPAFDRAGAEARLRAFLSELLELRQENVKAAVAVFADTERGDPVAVAELEARLTAQTYVVKLIQDIETELSA